MGGCDQKRGSGGARPRSPTATARPPTPNWTAGTATICPRGDRRACDHVEVLAGPPDKDPDLPDAVVRFARGRACRCVWQNELGGLTFEVGAGGGRCFVKWVPHVSDLDLGAEEDRLRWVAPFDRVPRVIASGSDDVGAWLATTPLDGDSAVSERWMERPVEAVKAIGVGLRHLHDNAPVARCTYTWSVASRLREARTRLELGTTTPEQWHPEHRRLDSGEVLAILAQPPPTVDPVVCHGDACAPNTLIDARGRWSGHVDMGRLGVADRWADLAVAGWSTEWNYGPGFESTLLDAYGIDPDHERTAYYRLLWDLA